MSKRTSLNSVHLLSLLVICIFVLHAVGANENVPNSEQSNLFQRIKRQFNRDFDGGFGGNRRRGPGSFRQNNRNNELIFSVNPRQSQINVDMGNTIVATTQQPTIPTQSANNNNTNNNNINNNGQTGPLVFINNRPTIATMAPFTGRTTASPQYLSCFNSCQTTSEYNPICGSDQELYFNEQKFNCAQRCGADIQIVRRGSCQGLFPMMRG